MIEPTWAASAAEDIATASRVFEWGWAWVVTPLLGLIGALVLLVRGNDIRRIDEMGREINELAKAQSEARELYHALNLTAAKAQEQLARLVSHADSEVSTRAEANRMLRDQNKTVMEQNQLIIEEVRRLTFNISARAEQKGRHGD